MSGNGNDLTGMGSGNDKCHSQTGLVCWQMSEKMGIKC